MSAIQLELFKRSEMELLNEQIAILQKQTESSRRAIFFRVNELEKTVLDQEKKIRLLTEELEKISESA